MADNYIFQINISQGGVPKLPIHQVFVDELGIVGDKQKDLRYHGGSERAISLFDYSLIQELKKEGHPIEFGSTGENLTIKFDSFKKLVPGIRLKIGKEVIIEISSYASPCKTIRHSFLQDDFTRISHKRHPNESRLYARVLEKGLISVNDLIEIIS